jgi:hypothetical protein
VWRAADTVQIGLDPERGTVLEGLTGPDRAFVDALTAGIDEVEVRDSGDSSRRARRLLALLTRTGVVVRARTGRDTVAVLGPDVRRLAPDAAALGLTRPEAGDGWLLLAARARRAVEVRGDGRVALALAAVLAAAGVGEVRAVGGRPVLPGDLAPGGAALDDVGGTPARAVAAAAGRVGARRREPGAASADLVVLVGVAVADSVAAQELMAGDVPHLAVVVRERDLVVGPLVVPGDGPCLRCLDLHRADRDPAWPRVLAQLLARPAPVAGETASSLLAASLAALQVLAHLDGGVRPAAVGATLEIELPGGLVSRRPWPVHPSCGCG